MPACLPVCLSAYLPPPSPSSGAASSKRSLFCPLPSPPPSPVYCRTLPCRVLHTLDCPTSRPPLTPRACAAWVCRWAGRRSCGPPSTATKLASSISSGKAPSTRRCTRDTYKTDLAPCARTSSRGLGLCDMCAELAGAAHVLLATFGCFPASALCVLSERVKLKCRHTTL